MAKHSTVCISKKELIKNVNRQLNSFIGCHPLNSDEDLLFH